MELKFLRGDARKPSVGSGRGIAHAIAGTNAQHGGAMSSVFDQSRGGWDFEAAISNALERVIWVFRCVDAIASNSSRLKLIGRKGDPYEGEIFDLDDTLNRLLNRRANSYETAAEFRYRMAAQLLLSKRGAFIEVVRNNGSEIDSLHLLPPHKVEPIPDARKFVSGYKVMKEGGSDFDKLEPENVIWIKARPHPLDPYSQMTPLMAAQLAVDTDYLARLYNRNFLINDGRPALLIALQGEVGSDTAREIVQRFNGGGVQAGRTTVLEADGLSTVDLGATPHEVQWMEGIRGAKDDILLAFGTPESVLGNASGRTYDNADAEREGWWKDTVQPFTDGIARGLDPLTGDPNDDDYIANDYSKVDVLQRAIKERQTKASEDFAQGRMTLDDYLETVGRERLNIPASRVHLLPSGLIVGKDDADVQAVSQLPMLGTPQQPANNEETARRGALRGSQEGVRAFNNEFSARVQRLMAERSGKEEPKQIEAKDDRYLEDDDDIIEGREVVASNVKRAPYEAERQMLEAALEKVIDDWSAEQLDSFGVRLGLASTLRYTRHWQGEQKDLKPHLGLKALDPNKVVQLAKWKRELVRDLTAAAIPSVKREARRVAQEMDVSGITAVMAKRGTLQNPQGRSALSKVYGTATDAEKAVTDVLGPLSQVIEQAAERQSKRVMQKIKEMDAAGASLPQIKAEIQKMIGERSSWRQGLATFVSTSAIEGISAKTYGMAGAIVKKVWVTTDDEHTRPSHRKLDGTARGVQAKFRVGGYWMSYPGDPSGGPEETANCRCWLEHEISERYADVYDEVA
jgi:HK97 family phage portal protein